MSKAPDDEADDNSFTARLTQSSGTIDRHAAAEPLENPEAYDTSDEAIAAIPEDEYEEGEDWDFDMDAAMKIIEQGGGGTDE